MSRRWIVPSVALFVGTLCVPVAWSQSPLAERLRQFRAEWSEPDSDDAPTATSRAGAAAANTAQKNTSSVLPQIDARSLLPTNLFGRAGSDAAGDNNRAAGGQPRAGSAFSANSTTQPPRVATPSRTGSVRAADADAGSALADGFTLPGLSRPETTLNRPVRRPAERPSGPDTTLSRVLETDRAAARVASRTPLDPLAEPSQKPRSLSPSGESVRRSPGRHTAEDFDPDMLRNELAGAFPIPGGRDEQPPASDGETTLESKSPTVALDPNDIERDAAEEAEEPVKPLAAEPTVVSTRSQPTETEPTPSESPRWTNDSDDAELTIRTTDTNRAAAKAFDAGRSAAADTPSAGGPALATPVTPYNESDFSRRDAAADGPAPPRSAPTLLVSNQAPIIKSDIRGPKQIMIGQEVTYRVRLENQGTVAAEQLVANVRIPSWVEVVDTTATRGIVRHTEGTDSTVTLEWQIPRLDAAASQTLHLRLVPRGSRPLELGISWTHAPVASRAVVEVQEPKLQMHISGPDDVLFAKAYVYRLNLSNPGTGVAEDVRIDLMPLGGGGRPVGTQRVGDLAPGASKAIEVELTAREAGKLSVQAVATAAGGITSEASRELFCRKPELEVDWRGPQMQYAGTTATFFVRVRNPGTASADDVAVRVALPAGAQFVGASEGHAHDSNRGEVAWRVGSLGPGDDCYMELRCAMQTPGENRLQITATTASGDLSDAKMASTDVVALADLTLSVTDPPGPVLVGDDAVYEIRIENRGAGAAEEVNVVALFSAGLEPQTVEGASYNVADGRVTFRSIQKLPAGQHTVLRIRARAVQPGTHVFRAEVLCRDLEIKLAAEETTRFYENGMGPEQNPSAPMSVGGRYGESLR